jgi:beta-lactamase superfamily II metal-dependent hydrolase
MGKLYTLSVGQGNFAILVGNNEAIVIDTHIPSESEEKCLFVKRVLDEVAICRNITGVILTGFDADHAEPQGLEMILSKFNPSWIMYPKYWKDTRTADDIFKVVSEIEKKKGAEFKRISVSLSLSPLADFITSLNRLSKDFYFFPFSPHLSDEVPSNPVSLVVKINEKFTGRSVLVTGDTESARWNDICRLCKEWMKSDILQAPRHGSKNGITQEAFDMISPHTVLVSAGESNRYGYPEKEALAIYNNARYWCSTHGGDSLVTEFSFLQIATDKYA